MFGSRSGATVLLRCAVLAGAVGLGAPLALVRADEPSPTELAAARQLFNDGKELEKRGAWAEAVDRFKKVAEVKLTPQVRFHIALCDEHLGHLVAALNGFELALEEARRAGTSASEVSDNAPARIEDIRRRVPVLRLQPKGDLSTSKVLLDGIAVAPALLGTDIPADPGRHAIAIERGGQTVFHKDVILTERANMRIDLEPQEAKQGGASLPSGAPSSSPSQESPPPPPRTPQSPTSSGPGRWPAFVAAGVGVASLGAAAVFLVMRQKTIDDVRATCTGAQPDTGCDPAQSSTGDRGKTYTVAADVLLGVGAAGIAAAGVLWFALAPRRKPAKGSTVRLGPAWGGARVEAAF